MPGRLAGRVGIVTGAAHGIGRAICAELAREGAQIWACDILDRELDETRRVVEALAPEACRVARVDVTNTRQVSALVEEITYPDGHLDIMVNNAGGVAGQTMKPVEEVSDEEWRRIFAINLDGAFNFTRAVAPHMKARGSGSPRRWGRWSLACRLT